MLAVNSARREFAGWGTLKFCNTFFFFVSTKFYEKINRDVFPVKPEQIIVACLFPCV